MKHQADAINLVLLAASSSAGSANLTSVLNNQVQTTQSFLVFLSVAFLFFGLALGACGVLIYMRKLKGAYKPAASWKAAAFGSGGLGIILLLAGLMGIVISFFTPSLIQTLLRLG